ncbi:MAG TPA: hypothetical protein VIO61_17810 [Anaerolineaceae bacterium]
MSPSANKPAWVQLYEARKISVDMVEARPPGRPPAPIPRKKVGLTLSQGEINEISAWQDRFSNLLGRKVSAGEAVGILVRISTARYARLPQDKQPSTLLELVAEMVGGE